MSSSPSNSGRLTGIIILFSLTVVIFWQIMALRSSRPFDGFALTGEDYADYSPAFPGYAVTRIPVSFSATEPNLAAYGLTAVTDTGRSRVFVRLAHGYNVRDCMRYKDYTVDLLDDGLIHRDGIEARIQVWHLTSPEGDTVLWVSSMLRASDYRPTDIDTRAMPFPSIGAPVDPGWDPRGLRLSSLRHPVRNFRMFMRGKWNNARRDLATLLRLRRPAWADNEVLTLITGTLPVRGADRQIDPVERREEILAVHWTMIEELKKKLPRDGSR